jgi:SNF2 family DNA or RNA helicase
MYCCLQCCNHPYLLDPSPSTFVTRGLPVEEHFDIGIKASGKLQLLEKILFEAKRRELRVIILFQVITYRGHVVFCLFLCLISCISVSLFISCYIESDL